MPVTRIAVAPTRRRAALPVWYIVDVPVAIRIGFRLVASLLICLMTAALPHAQPWSGEGRAQGVVWGPDDKPIEGAEVNLRPSKSEHAGPPPAHTDRDGHWTIRGLAGGRWTITIEAEGCVTSHGWIQVPSAGFGAPIEVTLRALEEISAYSSEGSPTAVREWIEKGNSFLEQGRFAEARGEYERVLREIDPSRHPLILRSIARTYFKEGKTERAVDTLKSALAIDRQDADTAQLLIALLKSLGRDKEAQAVAADPYSVEAPEPIVSAPEPAPEQQTLKVMPIAAVGKETRGNFTTSFSERSPLSSIETYLETHDLTLQDVREVDPKVGQYEIEDESFEIYVPEDYDPSTPYGLIVWISPVPVGAVGRAETQAILSRHRMIWIGANDAGNERKSWYRYALALDAVHNMKQAYRLDEERIYIAGYSGGGRIASEMAVLLPDVFRGGFYIVGCNYFRALPVPDRPGASWPVYYSAPPADRLALAKQRSRHVFLTGSRDFNRAQTKLTNRTFLADGFQHATYLEVPDMGHMGPIPPEYWDQALTALH